MRSAQDVLDRFAAHLAGRDQATGKPTTPPWQCSRGGDSATTPRGSGSSAMTPADALHRNASAKAIIGLTWI